VISPKRWRLGLVAVLAAFALLGGIASPASAAEPGESSTWTHELVNTNQSLRVRGSESEARNGNNLVQVWRGANNNIVWISLNHGNAFNLPNPDGTTTATNVSPTVVPYGSSQFMIIHVGTDSNIYYTIYDPTTNRWTGHWNSITGQRTELAVSAVQEGAGSQFIYLVYRNYWTAQILGTLYNTQGWEPAVNMGGGLSPSAPSVTFNNLLPAGPRLYVVCRGTDNRIWLIAGDDNGQTWSGWSQLGGATYTQPTITTSPQGGNMLISAVGTNSIPQYLALNHFGGPLGSWSQDITNWHTFSAVQLIAVNAVIYAILTGLDGYVYYKQAYRNP
jgi:hypothetical protein